MLCNLPNWQIRKKTETSLSLTCSLLLYLSEREDFIDLTLPHNTDLLRFIFVFSIKNTITNSNHFSEIIFLVLTNLKIVPYF